MDSANGFKGGTWQRYKLGQAHFTKWLKQTADKLTPTAGTAASSDAVGIGPSSSTSTASRRAQKKATKAGVDADVAVHWRQLEKMASDVVDNAQPGDIPSAPINILRDVIGLRKRSAKFFSRAAASAGEGTAELRDKNATHEHIIKVLEQVLAKFDALMAKVPGVREGVKQDDATSQNGIRANINDLNNMFEHLELHAPSDAAEETYSDEEDQPEPAPSKKSSGKAKKGTRKKLQKSGKPKKQRESSTKSGLDGAEPGDSSWIDTIDFGLENEENDDFDYYMMIYCFFEDFNLIRSYICERWCDYFYDRSVSLNTLAVITNAAFELFHQMEYSLLIQMRRIGIRDRTLGSYEFMMMAIFTEFGMEHIEYDAYDDLTKAEEDERIYKDEWDWLASPAFTSVKQILGHIPLGKTPMIRKEDRTPPKYDAYTAEELNELKNIVINDLLFDVVCVKALKKNRQVGDILPAESELLLGFQDALRNYDWSSAFVFSLQLYVDIRFILEDTVSHSFEQLQRTAEKIERGLPLQNDWAAGPRFELRRPLRQRERELGRFMLNDVVLEDKLPRYLGAGLDRGDVDDFFLLKNEPVWAGLLDFRAKLFINELGHEFVHRSFIVEAAAYLYAATRAASRRFPDHQDFPVWVDMEKFLASYTDDSPLRVGILKGGDDPIAILENFKAIMPENLIDPKPGSVALDAVEDQTQEFKEAVRIRQHLSKRYTSEDRISQEFMGYMRHLVHKRLEDEMDKLESEGLVRDISKANLNAQPQLNGPRSEERSNLRNRQTAARRKALLVQLSPVQQIQILEDTVTAQLDGLLSIDFMGLFHMSWTVLLLGWVVLPDELRDKVDFSGAKPGSTDRQVAVTLLVRQCLTGDPSKDAETLQTLVGHVKTIVSRGVDGLQFPGYESEEGGEGEEDESTGED